MPEIPVTTHETFSLQPLISECERVRPAEIRCGSMAFQAIERAMGALLPYPEALTNIPITLDAELPQHAVHLLTLNHIVLFRDLEGEDQ